MLNMRKVFSFGCVFFHAYGLSVFDGCVFNANAGLFLRFLATSAVNVVPFFVSMVLGTYACLVNFNIRRFTDKGDHKHVPGEDIYHGENVVEPVG